MITHGFEPEAHNDLIRIQRQIKLAFDKLAAAITTRQFVSFVVSGADPATSTTVVLPAVKDASTGRILRRALRGMILVAAYNLTDDTDAQLSFAQEINTPDQIVQTDTANLSAKKIAFILAG